MEGIIESVLAICVFRCIRCMRSFLYKVYEVFYSLPKVVCGFGLRFPILGCVQYGRSMHGGLKCLPTL